MATASALKKEGAALEKQGKYAEAVAKYREAVAADPEMSAAWFALGYALHLENGKRHCEALCENQSLSLRSTRVEETSSK